jgi:hypothetical protein
MQELTGDCKDMSEVDGQHREPNVSYTIEPADKEYLKPMETRQSGFWVIEHGTYERGSVLAGQDRWTRHRHYDDLVKAKKDFPKAEVLDHSTRPLPGQEASIGPCPSGYYASDGGFFDAGEYWDEGDY